MKKLDNSYVGTKVLRPNLLGAGGYFTELDYGTDGTCVISTDVHNGYIWRTANQAVAEPLVTGQKMPSNWKDLISTNSYNTGVWSVRIAPSNPNKLIMMWNSRVWKSSNKSTSWTCCTALPAMVADANGPGRLRSSKIAIDPNNPDVYYVCYPHDGVFYTRDDGATWTKVAGIAPSDQGNDTSIVVAINPASALTSSGVSRRSEISVFVSGGGLFRSTDGGDTFTKDTEATFARVSQMVYGQDGVLWLSTENDGLRRRKNGTWSQRTIPSMSYITGVAVNPSDSNHIAAQGPTADHMSWSLDGGETFVSRTGPDNSFSGNRTSPDIPWLANTVGYFSPAALRFDPSRTTSAVNHVIGQAEGIGRWETTLPVDKPAGTLYVWNSRNAGVEELGSRVIYSRPGRPVLTGCFDRTLFIENNNPTVEYPARYYPPNVFTYTWSISSPPGDPDFIVFYAVYGIGGQQHHYSTDGGKSWTKWNYLGQYNGGWMIAVTRDIWIVVPQSNGPAAYTRDRGQTWTKIAIPGASPNPTTSGWCWSPGWFMKQNIVHDHNAAVPTFYAFNYGVDDDMNLRGVYKIVLNNDGSYTITKVLSGAPGNIYWVSSESTKLYIRPGGAPGSDPELYFVSGLPDNGVWKGSNFGSEWTKMVYPGIPENAYTAMVFGKLPAGVSGRSTIGLLRQGNTYAANIPPVYHESIDNGASFQSYDIIAGVSDKLQWPNGVNQICADVNYPGRTIMGFPGGGNLELSYRDTRNLI